MTAAFHTAPFPHAKVPKRAFLTPRCAAGGPPRRPRVSPPSAFGLLASSARVVWDGVWRLMMAQLAPSDSSGSYQRPASSFLSASPALRGEAVVFIGAACGWCHRVMLARALLGLEDLVRVVRLEPGSDGLWCVADAGERARWGDRLRDVYLTCSAGYRGRSTAPLLVRAGGGGGGGGGGAGAGAAEIVSNESADILQLLPAALTDGAARDIGAGAHVWLRPPAGNARGVDPADVERWCVRVYDDVNNGVYKCGFATTQAAYEAAERRLFAALDDVEARLAGSRFMCSPSVVTEADVRLFPTAFRFDAVYGRLFRAGRKSIEADYPAIVGWMRDMYALPGVKETCDLEATRQNYYSSLFMLNPGGIVPIGREMDLEVPHGRKGLGVRDSGVLSS